MPNRVYRSPDNIFHTIKADENLGADALERLSAYFEKRLVVVETQTQECINQNAMLNAELHEARMMANEAFRTLGKITAFTNTTFDPVEPEATGNRVIKAFLQQRAENDRLRSEAEDDEALVVEQDAENLRQRHEIAMLRAENERLRASMARIRGYVSRTLADPHHLEELVHVMDELDAFEPSNKEDTA